MNRKAGLLAALFFLGALSAGGQKPVMKWLDLSLTPFVFGNLSGASTDDNTDYHGGLSAILGPQTIKDVPALQLGSVGSLFWKVLNGYADLQYYPNSKYLYNEERLATEFELYLGAGPTAIVAESLRASRNTKSPFSDIDNSAFALANATDFWIDLIPEGGGRDEGRNILFGLSGLGNFNYAKQLRPADPDFEAGLRLDFSISNLDLGSGLDPSSRLGWIDLALGASYNSTSFYNYQTRFEFPMRITLGPALFSKLLGWGVDFHQSGLQLEAVAVYLPNYKDRSGLDRLSLTVTTNTGIQAQPR